MSSVAQIQDCRQSARFPGGIKASGPSRIVLFVFLGFLLSGCDDYYTMAAYDTSPVVYRIKNGEFMIGNSIISSSNYDKLCIISPLVLISKFSTKKWDPDFSEEYFRVWTVKGETEKVEIIHESWIVIESGNNLCAENDEEIYVSKSGKMEVYT
ncbi:hypothetical protein ACFQEX_18280 [Roseibium salinum]|uniref:hypothetical protein n=1 Tax=Roseibium salinum TaxID=1604349 RepID=UPI003610A467